MLDNISYGLKLIRMLNYDMGSRIGPIRLDIAATSACNYNCYFCRSHSYFRKDNLASVHIEATILNKLLVDLTRMHVKNILFAGNGEPLLNPALPDIIKQYGERFNIEVLSNGSTLGIMDENLFSKLRYLTISLNSGNGKSHQVIHGYKGISQFPRIATHIERILQYRNARKKVKLNYVVTADNLSELEDFKVLASKWGVQTAIRPMSVDFEELHSKGIDNSDNNLLKPLSPCYNGFIQPYVESNGDVLLCCDGQGKPLGNLYQRHFTDIWQDGDNVRLRLEAIKMKTPLFKVCNGCAIAGGHSRIFHKLYSKIPLRKP